MSEASSHKLGEVLRAAREGKGVDLARVERDTKIRARYLSALENGEYRDLPGAVYTRGFLRNYGLYLSLDPEYLIDLYRLESSSLSAERASLASPPRPITVRGRRGFVLTPGVVVAAILTVLVFGIGAYLAGQLIAFAGTPELRVIDPAGPVSAYDGSSYVFRGVTAPGAQVTVSGPRENPVVTADEDGVFEVSVELVPGANVIRLEAFDDTTGRSSAAVQREIMVMTAMPSGSPVTPPLIVAAPVDGASITGSVTVSGTAAPGATITVTATPGAAAPASFSIANAAGQPIQLPPTTPAPPAPLPLTADAAGAFSGQLTLAPGAWQLNVAADGASVVERKVTAGVPPGLTGALALDGGASYLELDEDRRPRAGVSGTIVADGASVPMTAARELRIRAGNAGAVIVTINGVRLGPMGSAGAVVEWRITRR